MQAVTVPIPPPAKRRLAVPVAVLAARVEALPLERAAKVLGVLEAAVAVCEQRAAVALERGGDGRAVSTTAVASRPHSRLLRADDRRLRGAPDWIAGTIEAISPERPHERVFACAP